MKEKIDKLVQSALDQLNQLRNSPLSEKVQITNEIQQIVQKAYAACNKDNDKERKALYRALGLKFHPDKLKTYHPDLYKYLDDHQLINAPQAIINDERDKKPFASPPSPPSYGKTSGSSGQKNFSQAEMLSKAKLCVINNKLEELKKLLLSSTNPLNSDFFNELLKVVANRSRWNFVKELCQLTATNKEVREGVEFVFERLLVFQYPLDEELVCYLFSLTSENKPSDEAISKAFAQLIKMKEWNLIQKIFEINDFLTKLNTQNIDSLLENALKGYSLNTEFIIYLCSLTTKNKPSEEAINKAFKTLIQKKEWESIKKILEGKLNQFSKKNIETLLESMINHYSPDYELLDTLCSLTTENKPSEELISKVITKLADKKQWELIKKILETDDINQPSQQNIDALLEEVLKNYPIDSKPLIYLCSLTTNNKPSEKAIKKVLTTLTEREQWELIKEILELEGNINKPSQQDIDDLLENAFNALPITSELIVYLCSLTTNKPSEEAIYKALITLSEKEKWNLIKEILELEGNINILSRQDIETILNKIIDHYAPDFDLACKLCSLTTENKASEEVISKVIRSLATDKEWERIKNILEMDGINKPSQQSIEALLEAMLLRFSPNWEFVAYLCSLTTENKLSEGAISRVLTKLAEERQGEMIKTILEMDGINKPSQKTIETLMHSCKDFDLLVYLCSLTTENKPGKEAVGNAITKLAEHMKWDQVKKILQIPHINMPDKKVYEDLFRMAARGRELEVIQAVCSLPLELVPGEESFYSALNDAARTEFSEGVRLLCKIKTTTYNASHTTHGFRKALKHTNDHSIKKDLLKADRIIKLHQHIAALENHGEKLLKKKNSMNQGEAVVQFTKQLTSLTNDYASAFFSDQDTQVIQQQFSASLQEQFKEMGDHRKKWKINLANIMLAATGVGLLINYIVSGNALFFKTKRQEQIELIMDDLERLHQKGGSTPK
jgi:hypothetical protein